jgi:hypothetical protein
MGASVIGGGRIGPARLDDSGGDQPRADGEAQRGTHGTRWRMSPDAPSQEIEFDAARACVPAHVC